MPDTIQHTTHYTDTTVVPLQPMATDVAIYQYDGNAQTAEYTNLQNNDSLLINNKVFAYNDSICLPPILEEPFYDTEQTDSIPTITVFNAKPAEVYGLLSKKQSEPFTGLTVGDGRVIFTPLKTMWLDGITVALIIYFVLVISFTRRFLSSLFPLLFNQQKAHKQFEDNSQSFSFSRRLYFLPAMMIFSIYFVFGGSKLITPPNNLPLYQIFIITLITLSVIAIVKQIVLTIIGFVTLSSTFVSELLFNRQLIMIAATIILFPISILLPLYHNPATQTILLNIGLVIIGLLIVGISIRTFMLFRFWQISPFLWILYLCILEITPYLVLCVLFQ